MNSQRTVLAVGASGSIGRHVVASALKHGYAVRTLVRNGTRARGFPPYTIVRPAWFDYNKPDENRLLMLQGDKPLAGNPTDGAISRRQLAEVLVRSLSSEDALRKTFELHSERGSEQEGFDPLFAPLEADAAGALDGALALANMPLNREPEHVLHDLDAVRANF